MENSLIQILIICAYIGVLFLISAYVKYRSSGSVENYVLAGRKLTTPLVMVSVVGLVSAARLQSAWLSRRTRRASRPAGTPLPGASAPLSWASRSLKGTAV